MCVQNCEAAEVSGSSSWLLFLSWHRWKNNEKPLNRSEICFWPWGQTSWTATNCSQKFPYTACHLQSHTHCPSVPTAGLVVRTVVGSLQLQQNFKQLSEGSCLLLSKGIHLTTHPQDVPEIMVANPTHVFLCTYTMIKLHLHIRYSEKLIPTINSQIQHF